MDKKMMDAFMSWLSENGLAIIGMFLMAFAIKGNIKFDLNQWHKDKRQELETNLKVLCPHVRIMNRGGKPEVKPLFFNPPNTLVLQCQGCGKVVKDPDYAEDNCRYWANNIDALIKRNEQREKLAKKLGRE